LSFQSIASHSTQNKRLRYGLDQAAAQLPIEDFEGMLSLGFSSEIVTGALPIQAIGCLGKSKILLFHGSAATYNHES